MAASFFRRDCLRGKVALITGGGSGICFEITRQFLIHGCDVVVICGRRQQFLHRAAELLRTEMTKKQTLHGTDNQQQLPVIEYHVCDVREINQCRDVIAMIRTKHRRLDILVNGAAGNFLSPAANLSANGFATVMAIDAFGTFNMCSAAYSLLSETATTTTPPTTNDIASSPSATTTTTTSTPSTVVVINISATLQYGATWWQAHASAAKSAVDSLTRSLALEWGSHHIRVVGIAPGPIANTPGTTKLAPGSDSTEISTLVANSIPLGRMGHSYEIGHAAIYLCLASYVTGHTMVVDGGEWLYRPPIVSADIVTDLSRQVEKKSRQLAPAAKL
jgi:2,4-dienoyl-CoA reductase [(3E)-enoyl-CoA-producing], peroxisomal